MLYFVYTNFSRKVSSLPHWPNGIEIGDDEGARRIGFSSELSEKLSPTWFYALNYSLANSITTLSVNNINLPPDGKYIFPIEAPVTFTFWNDYLNTPLSIPQVVLEDIRKGRAKILFIRTWEADGFILDKRIEMMKAQARLLNIDLSKILYLDYNALTEQILKKEGIQGIYYNNWQYSDYRVKEALAAGDSVVEDIKNKKLREKKFLCFNRNSKWHRAYTVNRILEKGLDKDGIVTFSTHAGGGQIQFNGPFAKMEALKQRIPMVYDIVNDHYNIEPALPLNLKAHLTCYFNLVTESHYTTENNTRMFFTEKTFKPISCRQPFIMAGAYQQLKVLRDLGYKTFGDFIDESYDDIQDDKERLNKVVDVVEYICSLSNEALSEMLLQMLPILEHNYR